MKTYTSEEVAIVINGAIKLREENKQLNGKLDKLRFDRQAELTELERKTHIKYDKEIKRYKNALEEIHDIAFRMIGHMWEEDSSMIESIAKEAVKNE